ncbi:MAG: hypothetical protein QGG50_04555 [Methanopyri archaeon]|nr:hypothetical protein [Methanopyri archaeon]
MVEMGCVGGAASPGLYKDDGEGPVGPSREAEVRDLVRGVVSTCPSTL